MPQDRSTRARLFRAPALLALALVPAPLAVAQQTRWSYPPAERTDVADTLHGTVVADPYRWLEDPDAPRSREWIEAQNKLTFSYLEAIPQRAAIKDRLTALWNFERFGTPFKEGGHYFWSRNDGLQNQNVIYVADSLAAQPRVLIDPNTFSADGTVALSGLSVSEDGRHVAYGTADGGSDWNTWRVRDIATGADLPDTIEWVKFSGASWTKDGKGFFYSRYDKPAEGQALRGTNHYPKVHYHVVGTPQAQDPLIYDRADQKEWGLGAFVTEDGRYIILNVSKGTDPKNRVFYRDLQAHPLDAAPSAADQAIMQVEAAIKQSQSLLDLPDATPESRRVIEQTVEKLRAERAALVAKNGNASRGFVELLNDFDASYDFVGNDGPVFWFKTDLDAPRGKLIAVDTRAPQRDRWTVVIPEGTDVLQGVSAVGGHLVASYLKDAKTQVKVFNPAGTFVREVDLPGIGSAGGFGGKWDDPETFFSFTSFTTPTSIYRYDVATGTTELFKKPKVDFDGSRYETRQVFYTSKDGTKVPMFITHRKDIALDGTNPTFLYGYGGFNIPITPGFSVANAVWLEMGGVYAVANIRGGSEYGE
ncbi:MAG TPA: hypothetical protein VNN12_08640, partial [Dehalococcoidia bacterium]|nr:hypothetical protein [Dehalococcoidia bacterium]